MNLADILTVRDAIMGEAEASSDAAAFWAIALETGKSKSTIRRAARFMEACEDACNAISAYVTAAVADGIPADEAADAYRQSLTCTGS